MPSSPIGSLRDRLRSLQARIGAWTDRYEAWRFGEVDLAAKTGVKGEQYAARYLRKSGLRIVAAAESDFAGELDLVAIEIPRRLLVLRGSPVVVFVEVKTLATQKPGHPADMVDDEKQRRVTRAAVRFLKRNRLLGATCRFDVIAIWWPPQLDRPERIEHYRSAFEATGLDSFFT